MCTRNGSKATTSKCGDTRSRARSARSQHRLATYELPPSATRRRWRSRIGEVVLGSACGLLRTDDVFERSGRKCRLSDPELDGRDRKPWIAVRARRPQRDVEWPVTRHEIERTSIRSRRSRASRVRGDAMKRSPTNGRRCGLYWLVAGVAFLGLMFGVWWLVEATNERERTTPSCCRCSRSSHRSSARTYHLVPARIR